MRAETADDENRTIECVVASEYEVLRYDWMRDQVIKEILVVSDSAVKYRVAGRNQLPIVDSHNTTTVKNCYGSVRGLKPVSGELVGVAHFASDPVSVETYEKVRDGHLHDFSITAQQNMVTFVESGQAYQLDDHEIEGPAEIITEWTPSDASIVIAGADPDSTARSVQRSYELPHLEEGERPVTKRMRTKLIALGMPEEITRTSEALDWAIDNGAGTAVLDGDGDGEGEGDDDGKPPKAGDDSDDSDGDDEGDTDEGEDDDDLDDDDLDDDEEVERALRRALKKRKKKASGKTKLTRSQVLAAEKKRCRVIRSLCRQGKLKRSFADELCDDPDIDLNTARKRILRKMVARSKPVGTNRRRDVTVGEGQVDKTYNAMRDGLTRRALRGAQLQAQNTHFNENNQAAAGHESFDGMHMARMAEQLLNAGGINTQNMTQREIALIAMGHDATIRRHRATIQRSGEAFHVTGMFQNILLDASNVTLLAGYQETEATWQMWARQAESVSNLKDINRVRFSESQDLEEVAENDEYPESKAVDNRERYSVSKFGRIFSVTWETIVDDDLDALSRTPAKFGAAARRTVNKRVYQHLTANDALGDGKALFHADHGNLRAASAFNKQALNDIFAAMMNQKGLLGDAGDEESSAVISVTPSYLLFPTVMSGDVLEFLGSIAVPDAGGSNPGNSNTHNIYGPNGQRRALQPIFDAQLDRNSTSRWYAIAPHMQVDTVEVCFLQGEETPVLEVEWDFKRDAWLHKVRQTSGTKAIDYRGMQRVG